MMRKCSLSLVRLIRCAAMLACFLAFGNVLAAQEDPPPALVDTVIVDDEEFDDEEETEPEPPSKQYFIQQPYGSFPTPVTVRKLPDTSLRSLRNDPAFWYADSVFKSQENRTDNDKQSATGSSNQPKEQRKQQRYADPEPANRSKSGSGNFILLLVGAIFVGFLIYYLFNSNVRLFGKRNKAILRNDVEEVETEDIFAINYQKEIDKAAAGKNYRLAVRLMFLRTLKKMSERNIIRYKPGRTNFDYLMEVNGTKHYPDFFRVVRHYEYSWYGNFDVSERAYGTIKTEFDHFDTSLRS